MFSGTTRQLLAGMSASLSVFSVGQTFGWSSPVLQYLTSPESPVPMNQDQSSWVVASMEFGCWAIPFLAGMMADKIGRKWTLMLTGPAYAISWIMAIYSRSVWGLYAVRILQGLCVATVFVVCPLFLGEISETKIRGAIGTLFQISMYLGILYTYILGEILSYRDYQIANLVIAILFMVTFIIVPESPCYYIKKGREEEALKSLRWYRVGKEDKEIMSEYDLTKTTIQSENMDNCKPTLYSILTDWTSLRCILLLQGILLFRTFTHVQTIMAYASTTFASGVTFIPANYISILFAFILLLSIFPSTCLVDKAGRKVLLLVSTLGCAVFSLISCVYYYVREHQRVPLPMVYSYINFVSICGIGVFFNLGLGPLYNPLTCEYFPSNTRALSGAVLAFSSATIQLVGYMLFYVLYVTFGMYSNFLVSCVVCSFGVIWIQLYIVETKGKSFAEIQAVFSQQVR
uniref:Facilitated trehalose transporter Tret1 n=1 Tax=Cacopsylla melanoneura TaxID=428564 RepID=A0A8D8SHU6_9HEMI